MSTLKRSLEADENSAVTNGHDEQAAIPNGSPDCKRSRHSSSHSENEDDTQIIDEDNELTNDHSASQSETDDETPATSIQENTSQYSLVHVDFDNGENDIFRYDGTIRFHIYFPSRGRSTQLSSDPTIVRTLPWTLVAKIKPPDDTSSKDSAGVFSLFLKCTVDRDIQSWSIHAEAEFILLHPTNPEKNYTEKTSHVFNSRTYDWGYPYFKALKEIYKDFVHAEDKTIRIIVKIHADPPRNIEWNSKEQTGFVGLRNIAATCYINSFLQTIYFTKKLRKAVYALPTDHDDQSHSIPLALQKLFYDLQFSDRAVSTRRLTQSFGWDKPDEFYQHDIQEFCRVLLDKLECKMEGTTTEGIIPSLFQGQYVQYVRCTNVEHESRVKQTFYDVPLQVRNNANITESFRNFCKSEILTGENLYDAGSIHGLQEAEKGVKFQKFPPVLCLHLLRFEYDYNLSQNRKINDRYSFDYQLDLSEFLEKPDCSSSSYTLLSVLVHSGDNSSGHYVSFINPDLDGQWFKFDDDIVGRVASTDAMERNFGSELNDCNRTYNNTSAYMLVYIRDDCQKDILCDINLEDIPESLIKRFNYDKRPVKRRQMTSDNSFVDIRLIFNNDFFIQPKFCLTELIRENSFDSAMVRYPLRYITAQCSELFSVFAQRLALELGVNLEHDIRLWIFHTHQIYTNHNQYHSMLAFTSGLTYCNDYDKKIFEIFGYGPLERTVFSVYVEQKLFINHVYQLLPFNKDEDILLFVRLYNSHNDTLMFIGHFLFPQEQIFQKCLNDIALRLQTSPSSSSSFLVHQSVPKHSHTHQYESIDATNFQLSLSQALRPCLSGASIIIQIIDMKSTDNEECPTTADDYLRNLLHRQEFDVYNCDNTQNECLFKLYLPMKTSIKTAIRAIAERIEYPEQQIIIQKCSNATSITSNASLTIPFHISCDQILRDLYVNIRNNLTSPRKLYFKRLPFPYTELEHRRLFRFYATNSQRKDSQHEAQFFVRKSSTVANFLAEIKQWMPMLCSENGSQQLRMIELVVSNQNNLPFQLRICSNESPMNNYINCINQYYHVEEVNSNDIDRSKDSVSIPVASYTKVNSIQIDFQKIFPFFLNVIQDESFDEVKRRLQTKFGLSTREFDKYRFSIFNGNKSIARCDDNTLRINLNDLKLFQNTCWLGLEAPSISNGRKTRKSFFSEKPIRIH
ncbi:unnamed protein product [Adineta ricciae]|uniref:Ubiquitin carboxyl-terminal hydrolase 7 n=1 Tax=Adineta ricciae TaxID=249248 RepID=A0A814VZS4_ADIRI|nr:unnamed protein product [Adineta ricciae]